MKKLFAIALVITASALAANAQCDPEAVTAQYNKFLEAKTKPEQEKAGKEYIARFGACDGDAFKKITAYIKEELTKIEALKIESDCTTAVDKTPGQAFELCKPYVARDSENLRAYLLLTLAGVKHREGGDKRLSDDTVRAARKALDLIKAGKTTTRWLLADTREDAIASLEYYAAAYTIDATPDKTATTMLALAQSSTSFSKDPSTYYLLGRAVYESEFKKLSAGYKEKCGGNEPTPECDAAFVKIESTIDRVIDAYARAVALSAGKREHARLAAAVTPELTRVYKERHDSDAGLDKLVKDVLGTPIP